MENPSSKQTEEFESTLLADLTDNIAHGICVSNLTYLTAMKMGLDDITCYDLAIAGLVHDIGKLKLSRYLYGRGQLCNGKYQIYEDAFKVKL